MSTVKYISKNMEDYIGTEYLTSVAKGNKFLRWCLYYLFDKTDFEIENSDINEGVLITDGCNDGGIDAGFKENGLLHIIQSKYGTSHSYDEVIAFLHKIEELIMDKPKDKCNNATLEVYKNIFESEEIFIYLFIYYITNEDIKNN